MDIFSDYQNMISVSGDRKRDRIINRAKHDLYTKAPASPDYKLVKVNGEERYVLMHRSDTFGERFINCMPNDMVKIGDYVEWKDGFYLVTNSYYDDDISLRATITKCNRVFKWQDPKTLQINERWAVMYRPYTANSFGDKKLEVSDREFKVYVAYDEDTCKVDIGKRFILENIAGDYKVYEIIAVDHNSHAYEEEKTGYIVWNIEQAQFNPDIDNIEVGISDYQEPYNKVTVVDKIFSKINHLGDETLKIGGSFKRFKYELENIENKEAVEDIIPVWEVEYDDMSSIEINYDDKDIRIKALSTAEVNSILTLSLKYNEEVISQLKLKVVNII